jgi:hypothetical protein
MALEAADRRQPPSSRDLRAAARPAVNPAAALAAASAVVNLAAALAAASAAVMSAALAAVMSAALAAVNPEAALAEVNPEVALAEAVKAEAEAKKSHRCAEFIKLGASARKPPCLQLDSVRISRVTVSHP